MILPSCKGCGRREQTRTGHLQSAAGYLGWKQAPPGGAAMKELEQFLLDRAMEQDSPTLLRSRVQETSLDAVAVLTARLLLHPDRAVRHLLAGRQSRFASARPALRACPATRPAATGGTTWGEDDDRTCHYLRRE